MAGEKEQLERAKICNATCNTKLYKKYIQTVVGICDYSIE
jgi:hypothetical protein